MREKPKCAQCSPKNVNFFVPKDEPRANTEPIYNNGRYYGRITSNSFFSPRCAEAQTRAYTFSNKTSELKDIIQIDQNSNPRDELL